MNKKDEKAPSLQWGELHNGDRISEIKYLPDMGACFMEVRKSEGGGTFTVKLFADSPVDTELVQLGRVKFILKGNEVPMFSLDNALYGATLVMDALSNNERSARMHPDSESAIYRFIDG